MECKTYYFTLICILLFPFSSAAGFQATFTPRLSITEEYSDNIFLADEDEDDDFITTISAGFTAGLTGKFSGLNLSYDPSYAFYDEFTENDTLRHSAQLSSWTNISRNTRLELNDSFLFTEDPLSEADIAALRAEDPTAPIDSTIRRSREPYYTNTASLGLTHQFGEADSINLGYVHSLLENEDPSVEDNEKHNPFLGLTCWLTPKVGLKVGASYTRGKFDTSDDFDSWNGNIQIINKLTKHFEVFRQYAHTVRDFEGNAEDYNISDFSIGTNYAVAEDFTLTLAAGFFIQNREESDNESGLHANGNLTKTYRRGSFNITGSGGYEESFFGSENLGFSKFYEAGISAIYELTRHISGNIFGSYRNNKYEDIDPEREDKTTRGGFGITIQPLTWMSIELNYTCRSVDSTLNENDYEENRGLIRITLSPSVPFRTSQ